jgi:hypothetical protein
MEVTKCLKPSDSCLEFGDGASVRLELPFEVAWLSPQANMIAENLLALVFQELLDPDDNLGLVYDGKRGFLEEAACIAIDVIARGKNEFSAPPYRRLDVGEGKRRLPVELRCAERIINPKEYFWLMRVRAATFLAENERGWRPDPCEGSSGASPSGPHAMRRMTQTFVNLDSNPGESWGSSPDHMK